MKKIVALGILFLLVFVFSSCSNTTSANNSPDKVAINYLNGLAQQDFNEMDKYSVVEYEKMHKPIIESAMQRQSKTEAEIYAMLLGIKNGENAPQNYQEYRKYYVENFRNELQAEYGESYSVDTSIISQTDIDVTEKSQLLQEASDYYDRYNVIISDIANFAEIEEIKKMQCKVYISGEKETTQDFSIYVVKIGTKWKVLNIGNA